MPELWMPGATKYDLKNSGACNPEDGAKAIAHITWDKNGTAEKPVALVPYSNLVSYFRGGGATVAPHILWDPFTGQCSQFFAANSRSLSLKDTSGGIRTNRAGKVVLQFEALFFPYCKYNGKTYARLTDTPCKGWDDIQEWTESWGVPSTWPGGSPDGYKRDTVGDFSKAKGWFGHNQVPENDHTDPGYWPSFSGAKTETNSKTKVPEFPGRHYFYVGADNKYVTQLDKQLIRLGFNKYHDGNGYQAGSYYSTYTKNNVQSFQKTQGWSGSDADGLVGPVTWELLHTLS